MFPDLVDKTPRDHAPVDPEQRFRLAFENNMVGMILLDRKDKIVEVNDAFCQMLGRNREEIVAGRSEVFTHLEDRPITKEAHRRLISGEVDKVSYLKRYLHNNGQVIDVEVSKSAVHDATGSAVLRRLGPRRHRGTGSFGPALLPGAARLAHGARQPGAVREPALSSSHEDCSKGRVRRSHVVGPRRLQGGERHLRPPGRRRAAWWRSRTASRR